MEYVLPSILDTKQAVTAYEFRPIPLLALPRPQVEDYFRTLGVANTLRFRFSDLVNPNWEDVCEVIQRMGKSMYLVKDINDKIVAEFALESSTGKAAQIHFSTHPTISWPKAVRLCREIAQQILLRWRESGEGVPYLCTLVGLTPLSNRAACITVLKTGFKKVGVIPNACKIARHNRYEGAMLSVLTAEDVINNEEL